MRVCVTLSMDLGGVIRAQVWLTMEYEYLILVGQERDKHMQCA